jgi:ribosomal-protein-alanine N-acetyltransferase
MWLARDIAHWRENGFGPWTLHDSESGEFLGRAGLSRTTSQGAPAIELAWAIMPNRWGEGLATEAGRQALAVAGELGLGELIAYTLAENVASRRVMEKLCMQHLGEITHSGLAHILFGSAGRVDV